MALTNWLKRILGLDKKKMTYIGLLLAMEKQFIQEGKDISKKGIKHRRDHERQEVLAVRIATVRMCAQMARDQL